MIKLKQFILLEEDKMKKEEKSEKIEQTAIKACRRDDPDCLTCGS